MCGIVGYIGHQMAAPILVSGLRRLEYRGYDSAGVALVGEGQIQCIRAKGKLENLRRKLEPVESPARLGIGHTRWATHGKPEEYNAHPHMDMACRIAVVQNGIIENYRELKAQLQQQGHLFCSDTDTEVIPHLIAACWADLPESFPANESKLLAATRLAVRQLTGAFALAIVSADNSDEMIVVRQHAPLTLGFGQGEFFCASDTPALIEHTRAVLPLQNGDMARLTPLGIELFDLEGHRLWRQPQLMDWNPVQVEKQGFKHFMLKEIYDQPGVLRAALNRYINQNWAVDAPESPIMLGLSRDLYDRLERVQIVACGTSWHAGLVGKYWLEQLAGLPTQVYHASEFRYASPPFDDRTLTIAVTQSGETADTLSALELELQRSYQANPHAAPRCLGITNHLDSTLGQLTPSILNTHAGIEIGVAATKTFMAQLASLLCLAVDLAWRRRVLNGASLSRLLTEMQALPAQIEHLLEPHEALAETLAHDFTETKDVIFIGRGINYPIALEGALKLKEISYIHAEGYPAGEMKHGPIALLEAAVPVVAIAVPGRVYDKAIANAQEAKARGVRLLGITPGDKNADVFDQVLPIPLMDELLSPFITVIPLQFLAYHIAARRGLDVDQPRNLAKSVTVE